jgi:undecaprenyl diphosphate synthase
MIACFLRLTLTYTLTKNLAIVQTKMNLLDTIDTTNLPSHLAIIMDGNGRWAKQQVLRAFDMKNGTKSVNHY